MKHFLHALLIAVMFLCANNAWAVYVQNMPVNKIQPNGDTVHFFVTGDEFYHRYHDAANYTIVQDHAGYWVYAQADSQGNIQPTTYRVATVDPATLGLTAGISINEKEYNLRRKAWEVPEQYRREPAKTGTRNRGDFCNLMIFIRFADDSNYGRSLQSVDKMWNDSSKVSSNSVYSYIKRASYDQLHIRTYYAPTPDSNTILSFQDSHPRAYYMPYNDNNPEGYTDYSDRTQREFDLLVNAVNWINDSAPVPTSYNLDYNNDGDIDNVNFVVRGTYTGWSDLLWPHKWNLYGHNVRINGKLVNTFNFALEGAGDDYFGPSTFAHELTHSLGAPDLYHYNTGTEIAPVGTWDLMASNTKPPQHSTAFVKWKYCNWIDTIPLVTEPGTYTLHSVADSVPGTMALRFPSADPDQYYVVEYRDNTEVFETKLPGKGLLIYRIDTRYGGNSNWDGELGNEIWIFRPGSTSDNETGSLAEAYFTPNRNRSEFSPSATNFPFLADGTPDCTFSISNISTPGTTCSFRYTNHTIPAQLTNQRLTSQSATLTWRGNGKAYRVRYRIQGTDEWSTLFTPINHITLTGLTPNEQYEWSVRALFDLTLHDSTYADSSRYSASKNFHTELCNNFTIDTVGWYTNVESNVFPFQYNQKYNYSQQIYHASEMNGAKNISTLSLHYVDQAALTKTNCTIYLAHTTLDNFNEKRALLPQSELTQVYSGDLTFNQGWNEIVLDTPFYYNGTDNLVLAIDDNSGEPSRAGNHFYMNNTDSVTAVVYYSNDVNPGPEQDSIVGTRSQQFARCNVKFTGCPIDSTHVYACVISENDDYGSATGSGLYEPFESVTIQAIPKSNCTFTRWHDGITRNPRTVIMRTDSLFIAYFESQTVGIDPVEEASGYVVMTHDLQLTIHGADNQPLQLFDLMGRRIAVSDSRHANPVTLRVPCRGIYILKVGDSKPTKLLVH